MTSMSYFFIRSLQDDTPEPTSHSNDEDYIPYKDEPVPSPGLQTPGPEYSDGEAFQMQHQIMNGTSFVLGDLLSVLISPSRTRHSIRSSLRFHRPTTRNISPDKL